MADAKLQVTITGKDEVSKTLQGVNDRINNMKTVLRGAGIGMAAMSAGALKLTNDSRELNAQLGVTATTIDASVKELRELALETSNVTFPLKEVTATFDLLARAGLKSQADIANVANAFDTLGDAIGKPASEVTKTLIPALTAFGINLKDAGEYVDRFTWLTRNTTVGLDEFSSAMTYIAPDLDELGVSIDDVIALLAGLEDKGISGAAATKELRRAVTEATNTGQPLINVLGLSSEAIENYKNKLLGATGMTQAYANEANKQYGFMDKLKHQFDELRLKVGSLLEPYESVIATMGAVGSAMAGLSMTNIPALIGMVTKLGHAIKAALAFTMTHPVILGLTALVALGVAVWQNWDTICQWAGKVRDWFIEVYNTIKEKLLVAWDWVVEKVKGVIDWFVNLKDTIVDLVKTGINWLKERLEALIEPLKKAWDWIGNLIGHSPGVVMLEDEMSQLGDLLPTDEFVEFTESALQPTVAIMNQLVGLTQTLTEYMTELTRKILEASKKISKDLLDSLTKLLSAINVNIARTYDFINALNAIPREIVVNIITQGGGSVVPAGGGGKGGRDLYPVPSFQHGGVMPFTGLAHLERGERVLSSDTPIQVFVYLDSEPISAKVIQNVGKRAFIRGYS